MFFMLEGYILDRHQRLHPDPAEPLCRQRGWQEQVLPAFRRPLHGPGPQHRVTVGLEGPGTLATRGRLDHPGAKDCVWGTQERRLHHAEQWEGEPLRESLRLLLGRGLFHDGMDPHLLGS